MTFSRDFYDDGCCSQFWCDDLYGFGGLNGFRFWRPFSCSWDQFRYGSPWGYRGFRNFYGNRDFLGYGGSCGYGDLLGWGCWYPFSPRCWGRFF